MGGNTGESSDSSVQGQDEGLRGLWAEGLRAPRPGIGDTGPGNLRGSGIGAPKDQDMTEKAKHHSLLLVSIPVLKEGASPATAMSTSPSLSGPQSSRAQA